MLENNGLAAPLWIRRVLVRAQEGQLEAAGIWIPLVVFRNNA